MRFWWSVNKKGPQTDHEFLNRAENILSVKEVTLDHDEARTKPSFVPERRKDGTERIGTILKHSTSIAH